MNDCFRSHIPFNYDSLPHSIFHLNECTCVCLCGCECERVLNCYELNVDPSFATFICSTLFTFLSLLFPHQNFHPFHFNVLCFVLLSIPIDSVPCRRFWIFIEFPALYKWISYVIVNSYGESALASESIRVRSKCLYMCIYTSAIKYDNGSTTIMYYNNWCDTDYDSTIVH